GGVARRPGVLRLLRGGEGVEHSGRAAAGGHEGRDGRGEEGLKEVEQCPARSCPATPPVPAVAARSTSTAATAKASRTTWAWGRLDSSRSTPSARWPCTAPTTRPRRRSPLASSFEMGPNRSCSGG